MRRRTVRTIVDRLLLASVVGVMVTGVIIDQLDLLEFAVHSWMGYALVVLAAIHVGLNWRRYRRLLTRRSRSTSARRSIASPIRTPRDVTTSDTGSQKAPAPTRGVSRRVALTSLGAAVGGAALGWFTRAGASPAPYDGGDVGLFYHRESSLGLAGLLGAVFNWGSRPSRYKRLVGDGAVALPTITASPTMTVAKAIGQRRSLREYADRPMTSEELAWVVYAATGITRGDGRRTAPSAGALYPIETYVAVDRVEGIEPGLYHVDVRKQALEPIHIGSVAGDVMLAGLGQGFLRAAPVVFILTGFFQRSRWKYHERHYRYVCWEAGHIAQNVCLAAEAMGLGACVVGSFLDTTLNALLEVDGREEAALGLIAVGPR